MPKYSLDQVAEEIASLYGGSVIDYYVENDALIVNYEEYGEEGTAELKLSEIDSFMSM